MVLGRKAESAEKGLVQRSTDPIDDPWFIPRTVNGVRRSQVVIDVVTISQFDEENTLIGSPAGLASGSEASSTSGSESATTSGSDPAHAFGSGSGSATGSGSHDKATSSDEATSSGEVPMPRSYDPDSVDGEPKRWCVEGQWKIYRDAKMKNDKEKMAQLIIEERRILIGSLHTVLEIHQLFQRHKCEWMAREPGTYREEIGLEIGGSDGHAAPPCPTMDPKVDNRVRVEPQAAPIALSDDMVLDTLFSGDVEEKPETTRARVRMIDSTTEGAVIANVGTTEGGPNVAVAGSGKPDPTAC
uniref:Integrase core domain containing protein n=1 Tax=Solanum tuberosum TaxID=4113 RepID=M1DW41_SOLTU